MPNNIPKSTNTPESLACLMEHYPKNSKIRNEYEKLLHNRRWLGCLESAGVDNWSGYEGAEMMMLDSPKPPEVK